MADIKRTIEIIFTSTDRIGSGLQSVAGRLDDFEASVSRVSQPLADLAGGIIKTEAAVLGLAAAYGGYAVTQAAKYQTATNDLQKVLDDGQSVSDYSDEIRNLSETYGISASSVLRGAAEFKQAGFDVEASFKLQRDALDLVIAGDLSAADAAETLKSILKGLNAEYGEAPRVIEAMNNVSDKFGTSLPKLAEGMRDLSPILDQMGFSFEQGVGAITPIIERFGSGTEAARALRSGLVTLISSTGNVKDALAELGVAQTDSSGAFRSSREIFQDVSIALQGMEKNQKAVTLAQLFGKEQVGRLSAVFSNFKSVTDITNTALEVTGSVTKEVSIRLSSAEVQAEKFKTTFESLATAIGGQLLDNFTGIGAAATEINKSFTDVVNDGGLAPLFDALRPLLEDFEDSLLSIAKNLPEAFAGVDFGSLIDSFRNLGGEIGGLFGDLDVSKPEDLKEVLQGLVDFVTLLTNASAGVVEGFSPVIEGVQTLLKGLADGDSDFVAFGSNIIGLGAAINAILPALGLISGILATLADVFITVAGVKALGAFAPGIASAGRALLVFNPTAAAFAAALGAIVFAINENVKAYDKYISGTSAIADSVKTADAVLRRLPNRFKDISADTGLSIKSMEEFNDALNSGAIIASDAASGYSAAGDQIGLFGDKTGSLEENTLAAGKAMALLGLNAAGVKEAIVDTASATDSAAQSQDEWIKTIENGRAVYTRNTAALRDSIQPVEDVVKATDKLTEAQKLAISGAQKMEETLVSLASNEKIKSLEFSANIKVAQIEADAKKTVAAFESISVGISSANSLIGELSGLLTDAKGFDKLKIEDQIDKANDFRERELRLQEELARSFIKNQDARTQQIENGGSDISIFADNLAPELQAVLESLVNNIRIKAIAEGAAFITG